MAVPASGAAGDEATRSAAGSTGRSSTKSSRCFPPRPAFSRGSGSHPSHVARFPIRTKRAHVLRRRRRPGPCPPPRGRPARGLATPPPRRSAGTPAARPSTRPRRARRGARPRPRRRRRRRAPRRRRRRAAWPLPRSPRRSGSAGARSCPPRRRLCRPSRRSRSTGRRARREDSRRRTRKGSRSAAKPRLRTRRSPANRRGKRVRGGAAAQRARRERAVRVGKQIPRVQGRASRRASASARSFVSPRRLRPCRSSSETGSVVRSRASHCRACHPDFA